MAKRSLLLIVLIAAVAGVVLLRRNRPSPESQISPVAAAVDEKALGVLNQAEAACRSFVRGSYEAEYVGDGVVAATTIPVRGTVVFDAGTERIRASVTRAKKGETERKYDLMTDGVQAVQLDHAGKAHASAPHQMARYLLGPGMDIVVQAFGSDDPFQAEKARKPKYEGVRNVDGTACDVIFVSRGGEGTRWFFGQADHLPRRMEWVFNLFSDKEGKDKAVLTLSKIEPRASLAAADFQISVPEGYLENRMAAPEPLLAIGTPAPDWELKTPQGQVVRLSSMRGQVVVMDFWATWCGPCKAAMPKVQELHAELESRGVRVFGVNCMEGPGGDPEGYMKGKKYTYGLLMDGDAVARAYNVSGIPTFYVIDAQGVIVHSEIGGGSEKQLADAVRKAVETKGEKGA